MKFLTFGGGGIAGAFPGLKLGPDQCDVRSSYDVAYALEQHTPDVVIVTAGVSHPGPLGSTTAAWWHEMDVNLRGAFNVADQCIRGQFARHPSRPILIFIASVAGLYGKPNHAGYSASKAGVISLVQSLGMEGYPAYAISPGRVNTPMRERDYPNDTPGSRLEPTVIWDTVRNILDGVYKPGDNIVVRKVGLERVFEFVAPVPWKDELRVGEPVTI